jgi:hypothetical protein
MEVQLIGCVSHRLNLAVKLFYEPHEDLLAKVNSLMKELKTTKNLATLQQYTPLYPVQRNVTRWSSTFEMLKRYIKLEEFIIASDVDVEDLLPTRKEHRIIEKLIVSLEDFESVTKKLEETDINMKQVRKLFDFLIKKYPSIRSKLSQNADIVHSKAFESGIVKILRGEQLNYEEELVCERFKKDNAANEPEKVIC